MGTMNKRARGRAARRGAHAAAPPPAPPDEPTESGADRPADQPADSADDEATFVQGVMTRGEAVPAGSGELPAGATHEIVESNDDSTPPKLVRKRFSAW